jgi:hypothetical protein
LPKAQSAKWVQNWQVSAGLTHYWIHAKLLLYSSFRKEPLFFALFLGENSAQTFLSNMSHLKLNLTFSQL